MQWGLQGACEDNAHKEDYDLWMDIFFNYLDQLGNRTGPLLWERRQFRLKRLISSYVKNALKWRTTAVYYYEHLWPEQLSTLLQIDWSLIKLFSVGEVRMTIINGLSYSCFKCVARNSFEETCSYCKDLFFKKRRITLRINLCKVNLKINFDINYP